MEAKLRMEQYTCEFLDHLLSNTIKLQWKTSRRLAIFWRVVDIIHTCLHDNKGISKRDVYYSEHKIATCQRDTDLAIERLCKILSVPRSHLLVIAGPRGIIAGNLQIFFQNGTVIDTKTVSTGVSVPENPQEIKHLSTNARLVLIVEKNSIFHHLIEHRFLEKFPNVILMSGSGFPSQAFSQIVRLLRNYLPMKPFLILVDADPYGIHIAWFHLKSIATRRNFESWIGISLDDVQEANCGANLTLTTRDKVRAKNLLDLFSKVENENDNVTEKLSTELRKMVKRNQKAEMEALCFRSDECECFFCEHYLPKQLKQYIESKE
ncbi:hypothetical protein GAYE_SCF61G6550 [Galdieria yellowstonensis]|uniref:DNA topoisomerase (ATP-hydrolyzing) n=1 Tax=Galdieria yellowstonensis TaxID=3028027 RepID=A0AAV9IMF0_9RHOD|nr:hypothetical protein GAYE_SCF61G6550 [Galdieria yellowstonensis]